MASMDPNAMPPLSAAVLASHHRLGTHLRAALISVTVLAVIFVALRLTARRLAKAGYGWDDWLILGATAFLFAQLGLDLVMVENGLGQRRTEVPMQDEITFGKIVYINEFVYALEIALTKLSILLMYCRIFKTRGFIIRSWIVASIVVAWAIAIIITTCLQCTPIVHAWKFEVPGKCVNLKGFFIGNAVPNILTDVLILTMPIYHVWTMHVRFLQRATLTMIFLLGCFVVFASIYRFVTIMKLDPMDVAYSLKNPAIWTLTECSTAIISACLPTMRPLLTRFLKLIGHQPDDGQNRHQNFSSWYASNSLRWGTSNNNSDAERGERKESKPNISDASSD